MTVASVLLIRHGITTWNADQRWQGWTDVPLSPIGERQARTARAALTRLGHSFTRVVASDLVRARRTAALIAPAIDIRIEAAWRERGVGDWSGLKTEEIEDKWPGALDSWRAGELDSPPGGEAESVFVPRVAAALAAAVEAAHRDPSPTLVVSHGGVIRTLERHLGHAGRPIPNLSGRWFGWDGEKVVAADHVDLLEHAPDGSRPTGTAL